MLFFIFLSIFYTTKTQNSAEHAKVYESMRPNDNQVKKLKKELQLDETESSKRSRSPSKSKSHKSSRSKSKSKRLSKPFNKSAESSKSYKISKFSKTFKPADSGPAFSDFGKFFDRRCFFST